MDEEENAIRFYQEFVILNTLMDSYAAKNRKSLPKKARHDFESILEKAREIEAPNREDKHHWVFPYINDYQKFIHLTRSIKEFGSILKELSPQTVHDDFEELLIRIKGIETEFYVEHPCSQLTPYGELKWGFL